MYSCMCILHIDVYFIFYLEENYEVGVDFKAARIIACSKLEPMVFRTGVEHAHLITSSTPGLFLPTKVLDLSYTVIPKPPEDIMRLIALLAWVPQSEAKLYYAQKEHHSPTQGTVIAMVTSTLRGDSIPSSSCEKASCLAIPLISIIQAGAQPIQGLQEHVKKTRKEVWIYSA